MDFSLVKKWTIPEGDVLSVTDSEYNLLWEAPLQWDLEDQTVNAYQVITINVVSPNGEQFTIQYPAGLILQATSPEDADVTEIGTDDEPEVAINGVVGKISIDFMVRRLVSTTGGTQNIYLKNVTGDIVETVTLTYSK